MLHFTKYYQRYIIFKNICTYSSDQAKVKFDKTLNLNILSQELFITMVIVNFSNIFVTSSDSSNNLKHFQCNNIFSWRERAKILNLFM